jgi:integral membrane protein
VTPRLLFTRFATAEMVTWALLLLGMVLKYVTATTDLGVRVFGLLHGVVFLGYVLVTLAVWVNQRWSWRTALIALAAAVPPFFTLWAERRLERTGRLEGGWRFGAGDEEPRSLPERVLAWSLARPGLAVVTGVVAVAATTAVLLWIGPPLPSQRS